MGREFELKYEATPAVLQALRQEFGDFTEISMETTYFDTPENLLSAGKITLRRRTENGVSVCTVKTPGDGHSRGEWDLEGEWCEDAAVSLLTRAGLNAVPFESLSPVCGAKFTRLAKSIDLGGTVVELALDQGVLLGGGREEALCEMEAELKAGSEEAAVRWAETLAARYHLRPQPKSKFKRAKALAQGDKNG